MSEKYTENEGTEFRDAEGIDGDDTAGIALEMESPVLDKIVAETVRKQTGARGLRNALTLCLEDAAFEAYSVPGARRIIVALGDGEVRSRVERD